MGRDCAPQRENRVTGPQNCSLVLSETPDPPFPIKEVCRAPYTTLQIKQHPGTVLGDISALTVPSKAPSLPPEVPTPSPTLSPARRCCHPLRPTPAILPPNPPSPDLGGLPHPHFPYPGAPSPLGGAGLPLDGRRSSAEPGGGSAGRCGAERSRSAGCAERSGAQGPGHGLGRQRAGARVGLGGGRVPPVPPPCAPAQPRAPPAEPRSLPPSLPLGGGGGAGPPPARNFGTMITVNADGKIMVRRCLVTLRPFR